MKVFALIISILLLGIMKSQAAETLALDFDTVTLVVSQETNQKIESRFGHAFLRFSKNNEYDSLQDMAVEFAALIENGKTSVLRGTGIGKSYAFEMRVTPFQYLFIDHTQNQERNLNHYKLNLSKDEVAELIAGINDYILNGPHKTYNFFFRNCSSVIAEVLGSAVDGEISGIQKNIPSKLPLKLKEMGLIKDEFLVPSLKTQREDILNKSAQKSFEGIHHSYLQNLIAQLKGLPQERIVGYLKMMDLEKKLKLDGRLISLAKRLVSSESPRNKLDLMRLLNDKYEGMFQFVELEETEKKHISDSQIIHAIRSKNVKTKFIIKKDKAYLQLEVNGICDLNKSVACRKEFFYFNHPGLALSSKTKNVIELNTMPVAYLGEVKSIASSLDKKVMIYPEIVMIDNKITLKAFVIQDFFSKEKEIDLKGIHILNSKDALNPLGQCAGLTYLQKKLLENVFFRPEESRKSSIYYTEVIESALRGKQVFAFGVSNIEELTKLANQRELKNLISQTNTKHNKFLKLSIDWFKRDKMNQQSLLDIAYFAKYGLYTPIVFRPSKKIKAEHMLLIYGVKEEKESYKLLVYDSNLGLVPENYSIEYRLNKRDLSLASNLYKNLPDGYVPFVN